MEKQERDYTRIAREQLATLRKNPNVYVEGLIKFGSTRNIMHLLYADAVTAKEIPALEGRPEDIRRYYWDQAKADAAGRLTRENLIRLSKVYYFLDHLLTMEKI